MSALIQGTQEWLDFRRTKIGSSDAAVIMGVSPWSTPYELWMEKLEIREGKFVTPAMRRGTNMEEEARIKFEEMVGIQVFPTVISHPKFEWMIASLDGLSFDGKTIVEIKCPGIQDHKLAMQGIIPDKYIPQVQHQLAVSGLDSLYYFSYNSQEGVMVEVQRDDKYINENLIPKEQEFYRCMEQFVSPPMTEKDFVPMTDDLWSATAQRYLEVKSRLKIAEKEEKDLKEMLISMSGKSNAMGMGIKLSKVVRKGSIDYSSVPELIGVNLDKYRKGFIESWTIREC